MDFSIIVPVLNEINYIDDLAASLNIKDGVKKEIFFTDGGSTDGTRMRIRELQKKYPNIHLTENPDKYVSHGFNKSFKNAQGKYLALVGAHAIYPEDYFKIAFDYLERNECDAIGGALRQDGRTKTGKAIAFCMSSRFGVGNTSVRTVNEKKYVQSVAFGVYNRKVFDQVGLFDEALIRNQDDEFHYRLNQAGFRLLLVPEMQATYFVRDSIRRLFDQYYQYGFYKPLVFKKVPSGIRPRHIIPMLFVLYILSLPLALLYPLWLLPLGLYLIMDIYFSFKGKSPITEKLLRLVVFPTLHFAYGLGFIRGLFRFGI